MLLNFVTICLKFTYTQHHSSKYKVRPRHGARRCARTPDHGTKTQNLRNGNLATSATHTAKEPLLPR